MPDGGVVMMRGLLFISPDQAQRLGDPVPVFGFVRFSREGTHEARYDFRLGGDRDNPGL